MGARDTGWIQIYAEDNQEAYDNFIQAYPIAEDPRVHLPVMICQDGFITSHAVMNIELLEDEKVKDFVGTYEPEEFLLNPGKPMAVGPYSVSNYAMEARKNQELALENSKEVILEVAKKFAAYGVPLLGVSVSVGLLNMVDRFIIMLFAGDFGIYNANNTIASTVFTMLNTGIIRAVYPATLQAFRKGGKTEAQPFLNRGTRLYLLLAAPAAAGLCGISRQLSALIYRSDPHYVSGSSVIAIVAVAMLFSGLNEYAIKTWELRAQTVKIMQNALISVGIKIACSCALLPLMGFSGAAIGSLIGFLAYFLISYFRAKSSFVFHLSRRTVLSVTVGSVLCGVAAWVISGAIARPVPAILCAIPAGVFAYGAVMVISGELREEIGKLSARLRRS